MKKLARKQPQAEQNSAQQARKRQAGVSTIQVAVAILVGGILTMGGLGAFRYVTGANMNNDAAVIADWATQTKGYNNSRTGALNKTGITMTNLVNIGFLDVARATPAGSTGSTGGTTTGKVYTGVTMPSGKILTSVTPVKSGTGGAWPDTATPEEAGSAIKFELSGYNAGECQQLVPKIATVAVSVAVTAAGATSAVNVVENHNLDESKLNVVCPPQNPGNMTTPITVVLAG